MIKIKNLTLKNFLSVGNATQAINFDRTDLTLVLGENLDLGGDGARNGTGKTSILNGLSYALYGQALSNIRKDNLINHTNGKNMIVSLDFAVGDQQYRIERGRKPNLLRFYINDKETEAQDNAQGDSRETQGSIEDMLGMSHDMFKHIMALNTYTEPFLSLKANDQRTIIEQLLGITLLSERADRIKELNRITKDGIQAEEFRIRAVQDANKRIEEQITSLERRQKLWITKHDEDLLKLVTEYDGLSKIDITRELQAHKDLAIYNNCLEKKNRYDSLISKQLTWHNTKEKDISELQKKLTTLNSIDINHELQAHKDMLVYNQQVIQLAQVNKDIVRLKTDLNKEVEIGRKLNGEIETLKENKCYTCGQDFHDNNFQVVVTAKSTAMTESKERELKIQTDLQTAKNSLFDLIIKPVTHYKNEDDAIKHSYSVANYIIQIENKKAEEDPYAVQIYDISSEDITCGEKPITHYSTESEAIKHSSRVDSLLDQITNKHSETEPYSEQILEMEQNAIQSISFDNMTELSRVMQHQEFLLKLLTNKDSFIRKKIIEQNLSYLNTRLTHYLDRVGLPHTVVFQNDLSVSIEELGRELDFDNLSRGERNRLILSMAWAFRDVFESLYTPINLLFVDEMIDNGLDTQGVEAALGLLKQMARERSKSIWLVSHRDELAGRVENILKVVKENGFTSYNTDVEVA